MVLQVVDLVKDYLYRDYGEIEVSAEYAFGRLERCGRAD